MTPPIIVWLRRDLRWHDNPSFLAAAHGPLLPVYVWDGEPGPWQVKGAARWWLWRSLTALDDELRRRGSRLLVLRGPAVPALAAIARASGARELHYACTLDPEEAAAELARQMAAAGAPLEITAHQPNLIFGPPFPVTGSGSPYQVFTPFWHACQAAGTPAGPFPAPEHIPAPPTWPPSLEPADLRDEVERPWSAGFTEAWTPGEAAARRRLQLFADRLLPDYGEQRDRPDLDGTSRLSPHLHFGEISAREVWHTIAHAGAGAEPFLRQLAWREFSHQLLLQRPDTADRPLRAEFRSFPWVNDPTALAAWQQGRTGYPLVDAGMRQLWTTGWMHNRVRLVCASFLTKHLLIPWQDGARWFWGTLLDADLADNTLGWQWVSGCGADAAPYFRIFNPVAQGRRFDPRGAYVRRWLPGLASLPDRCIHAPWLAPHDVREAAGLHLAPQEKIARLFAEAHGPIAFPRGLYPEPIIDHSVARRRALDAYQTMRESAARG